MFNFSLPGRGIIIETRRKRQRAIQRAATRAGRLFLRVALWQHVTMTAFGFGTAKGQQMAPVTRVGVTVTFLRMDRAPRQAAPGLAPGFQTVRARSPSVGFYRYLYNSVGADYLWWLRRMASDEELDGLLRDPAVSIHTLYADGEPAGFFELDARPWPDVNLSYFGLMPRSVGTGIGFAFLSAAVDEAWRQGPRGMTVNTCNADHRRALPTYLRAGFRVVRQVKEVWNVPNSLGLRIPANLRL
jgi:GNAT superfamily N-acetyltransferase